MSRWLPSGGLLLLHAVTGGHGLVPGSGGRNWQIRDMMNDANILFKFCWSKDGYLAELKTEEEDNSISPYLPRGLRYWIGLTYIATEG